VLPQTTLAAMKGLLLREEGRRGKGREGEDGKGVA